MPPLAKKVNGVEVPLTPEEAAAIQAEWDANPPPTAQQLLERRRDEAAAALDRLEERQSLLLRALVLTLTDELNSHAAKLNALLTAIDSGATLAQVKANVAAIADYPTRTAGQVRAALKAKLAAGDADN